MDWLKSLLFTESAGQSVFVLCLVAALGLFIGRARIFGVGVGVIGVLAVGLVFGHFKIRLEHGVLDFARETGLILFVYTVGLQLGPSFVSSLRSHGLKLNLLAVFIVLAGLAVVVAIHFLGGFPMAAGVGIYTGAATNTPALGAAQEALKAFPGLSADTAALPGLAYAMTYPFGVVGIILSILAVRWFFRIQIGHEEDALARIESGNRRPIETRNFVVRNANLDGMKICDIPGIDEAKVTFSRMRKGGNLRVATNESVMNLGDTLLAVGLPEDLEELRIVVGEESSEDLRKVSGEVSSRRILVTHKAVLGKNLRELQLTEGFGVTVTRVARNGVELIPGATLALQIGDILTVVGETESLERTSKLMGNSPKALQRLEVGPLFVGITLGVLLGSIPVVFPGLPAAVKLGLAGGPLIAGLILSRISKIRELVFYMPPDANDMLREAGIVIFLACVGLKAGDHFVETLLQGPGLAWMGYGVLVTLIPLLLAGILGRAVFKLNYLTLSGTMAGSMTDPPALAFANGMTKSNGPSLAYATVYPLTMVLRLVSAQLLILFFGPG